MADEKSRADDLEEAGKKKDKPVKEKKGKADADAKGDDKKSKKEKKEKKKHPVIRTFFVTSLLWLLLIITFAAFAYLNFFTIKEVVLQLLNPEDTFETTFSSDIESLDVWETDLELRATELDDRELKLDDRESALDARESELDTREMDLETKYPQAFEENAQPDVNLADISSVVKTIEAMEPANAAELLVASGGDWATQVLAAMKPAARAAVFDEMTPEESQPFFEALAPTE